MNSLAALNVLLKLVVAFSKETEGYTFTPDQLIRTFTNYCENVSPQDIINWDSQI